MPSRFRFIPAAALWCAAAMVAAAAPVDAIDAVELDRAPYLQNMQPDSVEILWRTRKPAESWVEVRDEAGGEPRVWQCNVPVVNHQMRVPA